jgi:uncharacterized protein (DUF2141 family)
MLRSLWIPVLLIAGFVQAQATLTVVADLPSPPRPDALLRVAVCPDWSSFENEYGCITVSETAQAPVTRVTIPDLKPGTYAIKCYLDDNANEKLDTGWMGIPSEPYGFSNNASRLAGPPTFEMAKFTISEGTNIHRIRLK